MSERINSPATRSHVCLALAALTVWRGTRDGIPLSFKISPQPDFEGRRIEWRAVIDGREYSGKHGTVTEALDEIATLKRKARSHAR